jgi:hypothetical protein
MQVARRLLVRTIVAALCATAAIAIASLLFHGFDGISVRVLLTTTAISVCALLLVPAGVLLERNARHPLGRVSSLLTVSWFVLTLIVTWVSDRSPDLWKGWGIVGTLALAAAQACAVETRRRDSDSLSIRRLVGASDVTAALLAALGVIAILAEIDSGAYYRALGALAILDVLLVAVIAVLRRGGGPIDQTHRIRIDGRLVEAPGRDFAAAAAAAIRAAEREGGTVRLIERA